LGLVRVESRRIEVDADLSDCRSAVVMRQWTAKDKNAVPKQSNITIRPTDSFLTIAIAYCLSLTYPAEKLDVFIIRLSKIYQYLSFPL
jgi:hypothetical protein